MAKFILKSNFKKKLEFLLYIYSTLSGSFFIDYTLISFFINVNCYGAHELYRFYNYKYITNVSIKIRFSNHNSLKVSNQRSYIYIHINNHHQTKICSYDARFSVTEHAIIVVPQEVAFRVREHGCVFGWWSWPKRAQKQVPQIYI